MTKKEILRLNELLSKGVAALNETEKKELEALQAKAIAMDEGSPGAVETKELADLITKAVKDGGAKGITEDAVKSIVADAVKGIAQPEKVDVKTLTENVTNAVKQAITPGVTADQVKSFINDAIKAIPGQSKMVHDEGADIEFPIAHRAGNLTVSQKQLLNIMTGKGINQDIPETVLADAEKRGAKIEAKMFTDIRTKALTTTGTGAGAELVNVGLSSTLLTRFYMASQLAQRLLAREFQMPTNPFKFPLTTTRPKFGIAAELEASGTSQPGTGGLTLDAQKLIGAVPFSYEAEEDAIIALLPMITEQLGDAAAASFENVVINGDTLGTMDQGVGAKDDTKRFDGLRKLTKAQASLWISLATGGISTNNVGLMKKALGKWGLDPKNCIIVAGTNGYNDIVMLPETLTAEKVGNASIARVLTGTAPNLLGMDIIPSAAVREDLNALGVYDGTTTTKGSIHIIYLPGWITGVRRGFTVELDVNKLEQQKYVIASFRRDFKPMEALGVNAKLAVTGYNYNA